MKKKDFFGENIPEDVKQRVLKTLKPYLFKIPKWVPLPSRMEFSHAQSQLQKTYSENKEIIRLMDLYDNYLKSMEVEEYPNTECYEVIPWELTNHFSVVCLMRKAVRLGKEKGLPLLLGSELAGDILVAEKVKKGGKKGHEIAHGNRSEKVERKKEYQKKINELHRQNPKLSFTQLSKIVGECFEVTEKTIRNNTKSPLPPRKKQISYK